MNLCNFKGNIMKLFKLFSLVVFTILYFVTPASIAQNATTYVHPRAEALLPVIRLEADRFAPNIETPWYFPGLFEHESCISLKHSKCWASTAELRNNREHGVGLGQLTRTWTPTGAIRFDNLTAMKKQNPRDLAELSWDTIKSRPDLQIRTTLFMVGESYRKLGMVSDPLERLKMTDSAYNGGLGHVNQARTTCGISRGCSAQVWKGNVEKYLPKSKFPDPRYGGRSMYEINTHHVNDVFNVRMPKFKPYFDTRSDQEKAEAFFQEMAAKQWDTVSIGKK